MTLDEFKADMIQTIENFASDYTRDRKRGKHQSMIQPDSDWFEQFQEYLENSPWKSPGS